MMDLKLFNKINWEIVKNDINRRKRKKNLMR